MKIISPSRTIKNKARTLAEFKSVVKDARFKFSAVVTLCDKKHSIASEQMRIGSYVEACVLCEDNGVKMISYQAVYDQPPKEFHLETRWEYYR